MLRYIYVPVITYCQLLKLKSIISGFLQKRKWEDALSIDGKSWGFRRNADLKDYLSTKQLIAFIAQSVSCNGKFYFLERSLYYC